MYLKNTFQQEFCLKETQSSRTEALLQNAAVFKVVVFSCLAFKVELNFVPFIFSDFSVNKIKSYNKAM